jgi:MFS family permease
MHVQVLGGFLLASAITTSIVRVALTEEQVNDWGWRMPFWFSLLLAPILSKILKCAEQLKLWLERMEQKETGQLICEMEEVQLLQLCILGPLKFSLPSATARGCDWNLEC